MLTHSTATRAGLARRAGAAAERERYDLFRMTSLEYAYLSWSIVKEVAVLHGDVTSHVPALVRQALSVRFGQDLSGEPAVSIHTSRD